MGNVLAVFLFEWKRALTIPRMAWSLVLAGFPVFIVGLIRLVAGDEIKRDPEAQDVWIWFLFALVPMLVSMLGSLLWATPVISAELERRSWVYFAVRPNGGTAVLLGKYLAAVTWVIPPALLGLSIAIPLSEMDNALQTWWTMLRLVLLSVPSYAAIYLLLGVLLPRRAMVLAVAYTLILELVISFVPAVINKLTVQFRLRSLLMDWCEFTLPNDRPRGVAALFDDSPAWVHITILLLLAPTLLAVAAAILRMSEFSAAAESDV